MKFGFQLNERQRRKELPTLRKCAVSISAQSQRSHLTESETCRVDSRVWKHFLETGDAGQRPGKGHRQAITFNEDRYITPRSWRYRNMNATLLQQYLRSATGTTYSIQTVENWFNADLYVRRPLLCYI
ncbi:transposable element Tcb2 transposase [Trichonephila clavipes]|nr:transposable element Tcb2 transposase [Trichonephila clavipes]